MNRIPGLFTASGVLLAGTLLIGLLPQNAKAQVTINHVRKYQNPSSPGSPDTNDLAYISFDPTYSDFSGQDPISSASRDYIGAQSVTLSAGGSSLGPLDAYCVDIPGVVGSTPYSGLIQPSSSLATGNPSVAGSIRGGALAWLYNNSVVTSDLDSAALQLSIWEAEYDWNGSLFTAPTMTAAGVDLTDGNFRYYGTTGSDATTIDTGLSAAVFAQANTYLLAWGGKTTSSAILLDTSDVSPATTGGTPVPRQDLITNFATPEPGSLPLLGAAFPMLGLVGVSVRRRRRSA